jgi:heptose I phosphotransferase
MKTILEIEPGYIEPLRAAGMADFDAFMRAPAGPSTSKHRHRETVPLEIPIDGQLKRFYLKRVFRVPPRHGVGPWLRLRAGCSQPRHEWRMLGTLSELGEIGVGAMKRVAMGERQLAGVPVTAFLLVEAVPMPYTLESWLVPGFERPFPPLTPHERNGLLYELGRQISLLHSHGFLWPDIHPKHIFASPLVKPQKRWLCKRWKWEFCLIDLERIRKSSDIGGFEMSPDFVPVCKSALDELYDFLLRLRPLTLSRRDVLRLWAGYCSWIRMAAGAKLRRGPHWLPTWAKINEGPRLPDDFAHPRANELAAQAGMRIDPRFMSILARAGVQGADDIFALQNGDSLQKPGLATHRDRIRLELSNGNGNSHTLYLKRYRRPPFREQLWRIASSGARRSSAGRESHFIKRLSEIGIPTVKRVSDGQEMSGPWERRSFIVTEGLSGVSLERHLQQGSADPSSLPSIHDRREIIRQLALIARLMHNNRLYHRDLYLSHIFLTRNADGGIVLRVIDLARMIEKPLRTRRWRIKDLAALDFSATAPLVTRADRLRFMKIYCGKETSREELKREVAVIAARTRKIARHDARRRARLSTGAPA